MNASEDFEDAQVWLRSLHGVFLSVQLAAGVAGNCFVLLLVLCNRALQYRSVVMSLGLVVADLLIVVAWSSHSLANIIAGKCPLGEVGCSIFGSLLSIGIYARWCTIALITLERFCKVICPFCYAGWSKPLLITLSVFCWAVPIAATIPPLAGLGFYQFRLEYSSCTIACDAGEVCYRFYIVLFGFFVSIGGILPMILYLLLCIIGHRKSYQMKHITLGTIKKSAIAEEGGTPGSCSDIITISNGSTDNCSTSQIYDSTSSRGSWGGTLEKKILITFFVIFVNVFMTQLPIYTTSVLRSSQETYNKIPLEVHLIFVHIYLLGSVLDPFLIMRNSDFRHVIKNGLRKRQVQIWQPRSSVSVTSTLLDFAKMSSLLNVQPETGRANMRRNSCPSSAQNMTIAAQSIKKARSMDNCVSYNTDGGTECINSIQEEEEEEVERTVRGKEKQHQCADER